MAIRAAYIMGMLDWRHAEESLGEAFARGLRNRALKVAGGGTNADPDIRPGREHCPDRNTGWR